MLRRCSEGSGAGSACARASEVGCCIEAMGVSSSTGTSSSTASAYWSVGIGSSKTGLEMISSNIGSVVKGCEGKAGIGVEVPTAVGRATTEGLGSALAGLAGAMCTGGSCTCGACAICGPTGCDAGCHSLTMVSTKSSRQAAATMRTDHRRMVRRFCAVSSAAIRSIICDSCC